MSTEFMLKGLFAFLFGLGILWMVLAAVETELEPGTEDKHIQRYRPYISGSILPFYLLFICLLSLKIYGSQLTGKMMLTMCFDIFLHISFYYIVLMLVLPFLRKYINARTCSLLWLLPNYLYLTQHSFMELQKPLFIIHATSSLVKSLCYVWAVGFVVVLSWRIANHLHFRRQLLKNAMPVIDPETLALLHAEVKTAQIKKPKFRLVQTDNVKTPITIGLFPRSTRIILPQKQYAQSELKLIFRHEVIHICREDSWLKFFMVFCTAMCWFNPLMWFAMKKSAEDIELSCDETVLLNVANETRTEYANLILNTAGDDRGFSTCLSSAATTMRYRLKSIVKPNKRRSGAIIAGLTFFMLIMTCGHISLAYGDETGADTVFRGNGLDTYEIDSVTFEDCNYKPDSGMIDLDLLTAYIADLRTQEMTGNYSFSNNGKQLTIWYNGPEGLAFVYLYSDYVKVYYLADENDAAHVYHLPDGMDWEYISSILPPLPQANVTLSGSANYGTSHIQASIEKLVYRTDTETQLLQYNSYGPEEGASIYSSIDYTNASIDFSMPLASSVKIDVEALDSNDGFSITENTFELAEYPAKYTIHVYFEYKDGIYDTTFVFYVGDMYSI